MIRRRGRPLRFVAMIGLAWIGARTLWWPVAHVLPTGSPQPDEAAAVVATDLVSADAPIAVGDPVDAPATLMQAALAGDPAPVVAVAAGAVSAALPSAPGVGTGAVTAVLDGLGDQARSGLALIQDFAADDDEDAAGIGVAAADTAPARTLPGVPDDAASGAGASPWRVSAFAIARPGGGDPRLVPLLGASQAGVRVAHTVGRGGRRALFARVAAPLSTGDPGVAAGVSVTPRAGPVTLFAEARRPSGGGLAPAAGAFGGVSGRLPARFRIDAYGQSGWVGGRIASGFAEGQSRVARPLSVTGRLDAGVGAWGAVQRGAGRLDIGPTVGVAVPVARGTVRLNLDWRRRVAGRARPGSGPALSLGADF